MLYNIFKFILFNFFLLTIYYYAFWFIDLISHEQKIVLVLLLLLIINAINYVKISEMLFENSLISIDFIIYDILNIAVLIGIICLYFLIAYSAIIIYITKYGNAELTEVLITNII